MKTSDLIGKPLDWAVSIALGHKPEKDFHSHGMTWNGWWETAAYIDTKPNEYRRVPDYSSDWEYGGPIIDREKISLLHKTHNGEWHATIHDPNGALPGRLRVLVRWHKSAPLIAAMRCYVASKLGDEVDVPEELK